VINKAAVAEEAEVVGGTVHECGCQVLSRWKVLNDTVGFVMYSALLKPHFF
jgi:fatty acid desaturase